MSFHDSSWAEQGHPGEQPSPCPVHVTGPSRGGTENVTSETIHKSSFVDWFCLFCRVFVGFEHGWNLALSQHPSPSTQMGLKPTVRGTKKYTQASLAVQQAPKNPQGMGIRAVVSSQWRPFPRTLFPGWEKQARMRRQT